MGPPVRFPRKTRKARPFWQKNKKEDVLLIYFEHIFTFCAVIYSNTNPLQLFCEKSSLNSAKCSLGIHFEGKFVYLPFISQISKSPFLVNQDILCAGSKILLLKFDSVCTCLGARFIWGQESFSSRSDVFRQLHFHAQIYWKWYKLYSMFTLMIGG